MSILSGLGYIGLAMGSLALYFYFKMYRPIETYLDVKGLRNDFEKWIDKYERDKEKRKREREYQNHLYEEGYRNNNGNYKPYRKKSKNFKK